MFRKATLIVCSLAATFVAANAHAEVIWRGDYQTGNLTQWSSEEEEAPDRLQVQSDFVPFGAKYAMRTEVKPGDLIDNGNRAEVDYTTDRPGEGDDRYYHWKTMFPDDFNSADYWQIFTQWHQYNTGGSPPLAMMTWAGKIQLGNNLDDYFWTTPLVTGVWHDFIVHVKWSTDATVGGVEVWYDGQHVLPFTHTATAFPDDTVYVKQGIYRKDIIDYDQVLYHEGMTIGTSLADVQPPATPEGQSPSAATGSAVADSAKGVLEARQAGCETAGLGSAIPAALMALFALRRRRAVRPG